MNKTVFIDTNAFFKRKETLFRLISEGYVPVINDIVVYEFLKIIDDLINSTKNIEKKKLYEKLKKRFFQSINSLGITIGCIDLSMDDLLPNHPQMWRPYLAIMSHFGGKYITSNWAEWEFQFKLWLRTRHGIKSGDEMIMMHFIGYRYNLQSSSVRREAIIDLVCKSHIF